MGSGMQARAIKAWQGTSRLHKTILGAAALSVIVAALWAAFLSGRGEYATLFTGLDARDAAEIVSALEADSIPFRLTGNGRSIAVPAADVHRIRLKLAMQGLPSGGVVGFELMDRSRFGSTDFERRLNYLRALQGELARTIGQMAGIENARVHVVIPQPSLYVSERRPATAAVFLKLKPYARLDAEQVRGVMHLVARSVEGLKPEDVTVVDVNGRILSAELQDEGRTTGTSAFRRLQVEQEFRQQLERSVQTLLEQVFGPGNVTARVNAELNFEERVIDRNLFQPVGDGEGVLRSIRELEEFFEGEGGVAAAGMPGVQSNVPGQVNALETGIPGYQGVRGGTGSSVYQKRDVTRNLEMNEIRERIVVAPGTVRRLSVAVVINRRLTAAEQQAVEKTVSSAIGLDPDRTDRITVLGMDFNTTMAEELKDYMAAEERARRQERLVSLAVLGAGLLVLAVVVLQGLKMVTRWPERVYVSSRRERQDMAPGLPEAATEEPAEVGLRREVERLARQKPETVAQLIATWLIEDQGGGRQ